MARWQYQIWAFVPQQPITTVALDWLVQQPTPTYPTYRLGSVAWTPEHQAAEGSALDWLPRYPDQVFRGTVRAADQSFFISAVLPIPELAWAPRYPDQIARWTIRAADHPFFVSGATASSLPVPDLAWTARYPDRIDRGVVRAADQPFFTTGSTASSLPVVALSWAARYPDQIGRTTLPTAAIPSLSLEPFPRVAADRLFAWAIYPDRISRTTLPVAGMPSFAFGTLDPIPNVSVLLEDRILLGQNQSIETPAYPSIGGSSTWS